MKESKRATTLEESKRATALGESKGATTSKLEDEIDRISDLSDDILHLILSRLPSTEEVVRTSILSTRWRYLRTSFPYSCLRIGFSFPLKAPSEIAVTKLREFMSRVLVNETMDLDVFTLCCYNYYDMKTVGQWIDAAVTRNVNLIHLLVCPKKKKKDFKVPYCLVNNGSLKIFRLFLFGGSLSLPHSTGLPSLRVLALNKLKFANNYFAAQFLKTCPYLVDLTLMDSWLKEDVMFCITCPNLKKLTIINREVAQAMSCYVGISCPKLVFWEVAGFVYHNFLIVNLDSLEKAVFHPEPLRLSKQEVLAEISNPGDYALRIFFKKPEEPEVGVPVPPLNPRTVELTTTIDFLTKEALICFLVEFPNLKSLHLIIIQGPFWPTLYSNLGEKIECES